MRQAAPRAHPARAQALRGDRRAGREIAGFAGVTERTLYKYAQKGGWKPRYAWVDRGGVAHRRWRAQASFAPGNFVPAKGAGGRFVKRADKGKPFARGLKATDRVAAARAAASCAGAEALGRQALAEAAWLRWSEAFLTWLTTANGVRAALAAHRAGRRKARAKGAGVAPDAQPDAYERWLDPGRPRGGRLSGVVPGAKGALRVCRDAGGGRSFLSPLSGER